MKILTGESVKMNKQTGELINPQSLGIKHQGELSVFAVYTFNGFKEPGSNTIECSDYREETIKIVSELLEYNKLQLTNEERKYKDLFLKALKVAVTKPGLMELFQSNGGGSYHIKIYPLMVEKEVAKLFSITQVVNFQGFGFRMIHDNSIFARLIQNKKGEVMLIAVTDQEKMVIIRTKDESRKYKNVFLLVDGSVKKVSGKELPKTTFPVSEGLSFAVPAVPA